MEIEQKKVQFVDVEKIIRSQKKKIIKNLPKFIIRYIKKLIHQDEVNEVIKNNQDKFGFDFVKGCVDHLNLKVKVFNEKYIPNSGRFIFAANHSLGAVDFGAVIMKIHEKFKNIKILANDLFLQVENTRNIFLPVATFKKNEPEKREANKNKYEKI